MVESSARRARKVTIFGAVVTLGAWLAFSNHADVPQTFDSRTLDLAASSVASQGARHGGSEFALPHGSNGKVQRHESSPERFRAGSNEERLIARFLREVAAEHGLRLPHRLELTQATWEELTELHRASWAKRVRLALERVKVVREIVRARVRKREYEDYPGNTVFRGKRLSPRFRGQFVTAAPPPERGTVRIVRINPGESTTFDELQAAMNTENRSLFDAAYRLVLRDNQRRRRDR